MRDPPYNMAVNIRVKVHPVVLFQIADAYERRDMEKYRVIGTLLGKYHNQIDSGRNRCDQNIPFLCIIIIPTLISFELFRLR